MKELLRCKPLILMGGIPIHEKVRLIQKRFGIDVEWSKIENSGPRAANAVLSRIRQKKVGAVILLEGFMGHSVTDATVATCNQCEVPWAYGGRAGVGNLTAALSTLNKKAADLRL